MVYSGLVQYVIGYRFGFQIYTKYFLVSLWLVESKVFVDAWFKVFLAGWLRYYLSLV